MRNGLSFYRRFGIKFGCWQAASSKQQADTNGGYKSCAFIPSVKITLFFSTQWTALQRVALMYSGAPAPEYMSATR